MDAGPESVRVDQMPEYFLAHPRLHLGQRSHIVTLIANVTSQLINIKAGQTLATAEVINPEIVATVNDSHEEAKTRMYDAACGDKWVRESVELDDEDWRSKCSMYSEVIDEVKQNHLSRADMWIERNKIKFGEEAPQWFRDQLPYKFVVCNVRSCS